MPDEQYGVAGGIMSREKYIRSLDLAANQYKLALQTKAAADLGAVPQRLIGVTYGGLHIDKQDNQLSPEDAAFASSALEHTAMFTLAVAADTALERTIPDRFNESNQNVATAARIARILRNAFSHDPFFPRWICTNPNHLGQFTIPDVISLDTRALNGQEIDWRHYGGPLAILRFLRYCQSLIAAEA
jgi:hypothetical protein